ncbi:hypothetical protein MP228_007366 [Amoeboaphelidium protococcarum]|nr:hypothetical protein MP228_007366 [Amoeboaphelidium protococcarum]
MFPNGQDRGSFGMQQVQNERRKVDGANSQVDEVLEMAFSAQQSLHGQRDRLLGQRSRLNDNVLTRVPQINSLLNKIGVKKKKDAIVLGLVIAGCIVLLLLYRWGLS